MKSTSNPMLTTLKEWSRQKSPHVSLVDFCMVQALSTLGFPLCHPLARGRPPHSVVAFLKKAKNPAERLRIKSLPGPFQDFSKLAFDRFDLDSSGRLCGRCLRRTRLGWLVAFRRFR